MKKKFFAFLLSLALLLTVFGLAAAEAITLPQVGDEISGFVVKSITPMQPLGATGVLFEHQKTGAQLLYLASEDTNRSFDIAFRTPALDNMGKPHVFEHMTICGSQKYPDANMFLSVVNQAYSTFINATTYHGMTSYPLASLSEDQLLALMDYYLSGVFEPLVYTEPRMVQREAWRYELTDADAPLTLAGTVYSEMQGALTASRQADHNNMLSLFQGGKTAYLSGGMPSDIPLLTQESLIAFHDAYYHPSNALITLYGKMDYASFMTLIDQQYLSKYDRKDIEVEMGRVEPYTETLYATYDAPVEQGAQTENASYIYYSFGADGAELEDYLSLNLLSSLLWQESSPLMQALREALPQASISMGVNIDLPVPTFSIVASGVNESDRDLFVKTVDDSLAQIAGDGISQTDLDALLSAAKLELLLVGEDQNLGVNASQAISLFWTYFGRTDYYPAFEAAIDKADTQQMLDTLNRWVLGNTYRAVAVTRPAAGLAEQNAAKLEEELAQVKADMTDEEIADRVQQTADFAEWSAAAPDAELMAQVVVTTPDTLPVELVHYDVTDEEQDGVRYVTSEAQVTGVGTLRLMLDGSTIPVEQLQDVELYLNLLGSVDTDEHSKEELSSLILRYTSGFGAGLNAQNSYVEGATPLYTAMLSCNVLREDVPAAAALLRELILRSDFTDTDTIRQYIVRENSYFEQTLDEDVLSVQLLRASAALDSVSAYSAQLSGFDFYEYMTSMLTLDDAALTARLEAARDFVLSRTGAIVACAGDKDTIAAIRTELGALLAELPATEREPVDYSVLCKDIQWDAVTVNSTVQMNVIVGASDGFTGKDVVLTALMDDTYLLPQLRSALGAYGAYSSLEPFGQLLYSYRDPNLVGTFEVFEALPEYLRTADITKDMVNTYIVGSYTSLSRPQGALSGAITAVNNSLIGLTEEIRLRWMEEARQTTVDDVRALADRIQNLVDNGVRSTSATASTIEKNKELFTSVVTLNTSANEE
ncbi:MAG: insulinase family protein [Eubacteriales bacterium]|nr:insulinase family protein [Eubacteriales bacterium]